MTTDFLWGSGARGTRGPKPALSLEKIADTAIAIADAEGLAAVSMQRVAGELGYTKMSLYRYLPGKAEMVALMVERALSSAPAIPVGDRRTALREWARALLDGYIRHPWTLSATVGPRLIGPNELTWLESALTVLAGTPLTGAERLDAIVVLVGHARMLAEQATSRLSESELSGAMAAVIAERGDRFPELSAAMADTAAAGGQDQAFDFGLDRILDGLESLILSRRTG
jgi:AcrR family transcriptional regulator